MISVSFKALKQSLQRVTTSSVYYPEIDGIRFLAIILVVLYHIRGSVENIPESLNILLDNGVRGVQLFFVLSGFIIGLPFAKYYLGNGEKIRLKSYYLRRFTRLEPPYILSMLIFFLALVFVTKTYTFSFLLPRLLASLIYAHNIIYHEPSLISVVAWSLEIEIQFYLIAPVFLLIFKYNTITRRIILLILVFAPIISQEFYQPSFQSLYYQSQYFLTGLLLTDVYLTTEPNWLKRSRLLSIIMASCLLLLILWFPVEKSIFYKIILLPLILFLFYLILKNNCLKKMAGYGWIPIIGGMCYSIYLIHFPVISQIKRMLPLNGLSAFQPVNILLEFIIFLVGVAIISILFYRFVERPFMTFKPRQL